MRGSWAAAAVLVALPVATDAKPAQTKQATMTGAIQTAASEVQVPATSGALQKALETAPAGARLVLAAGVHDGGLTVTKSVTLLGAGVGKTTIRAPGRFSVLRIDQDGLNVRIEGVTLQGGVAGEGGGLRAAGRGKLTVVDCAFTGNKAGMGGGGGLYARFGLLHVERTVFSGNDGKRGGGVYLETARAEFVRCLFRDNAGETGGGVQVGADVEVAFKACTWQGNKSSADADAALHVAGARAMQPKVEVAASEADGALVNGNGTVRIQSSKVPARWKVVAGVKDGGGNTWK
jgi:hypothetical protein